MLVHVLPPGWLQVIEGEDTANTFSGNARADGCEACSGGQKVRFIGNGPNHYLTMNDLTVAESGEYDLIIDYTLDGTRSFFVSVNGGDSFEVPVNGTSWAIPVSVSVPVSLEAGANTIRFHNDAAHAPDLDRIVIAEPG
jgi:hypothetical protein